MKKSLLITLGHNSSAIFHSDEITIGYEQERLSKVKADSRFPIDAILEIVKNVGFDKIKGCDVFVSHWFNTDSALPNKYIGTNDLIFLNSISGNVIFCDSNFTHHDAHAYSALAFYNYHKGQEPKLFSDEVYTIVADGFGNNEEVLSIYFTAKNKQTLVKRVYGYKASLGLMYQFATAFCGMKENQDEYKFLGYESYIESNFKTEEIDKINDIAYTHYTRLLAILDDKTDPVNTKTIIDHKNLAACREEWYKIFDKLLDAIEISNRKSFAARVAIGYFVQHIIEKYFTAIIDKYNIVNLIVCGGCFYNVKLNNALLSSIKGELCIMPLAGDQGAAIGMEYAMNGETISFDTLAIGVRDFYNTDKLFNHKEDKNIFVRKGDLEAAKEIAQKIADGKIVNIINGNMEFGPRALCNTSTVMLPSKSNVAINNMMNDRNEVMPCAPICTQANADILFNKNDLKRVIGSDKFMICAHDYVREYSGSYGGVMHNKPLKKNTYTGRPQIVDADMFIFWVLNYVERLCDTKCLVNTSFNYHGQPIVFTMSDIIRNYNMQVNNLAEHNCAETSKLNLYIIL